MVKIMKKYSSLLIVTIAVFSLLMLSEKVLATTGGPTYISEIAYNASSSSVYYLENDNGGRGCPPIIHQVNLTNKQDVEVKTCDQVLDQYFKNYSEESDQKYRQFISNLYENVPYKSFSYVGSVSLKKNNIDISVSALSDKIENGEKYWTEFRAIVLQDNKEVARIDFRGCDIEQPHTFEGYMIPNSDVLAILISNNGDCFEGGYIRETLHIVKGIKYYDTNIVRGFKQASATEPNSGNMIVFTTSKDVPVSGSDINNSTKLIVAVVFIAGILLGYLIGKRSARVSDKNL